MVTRIVQSSPRMSAAHKAGAPEIQGTFLVLPRTLLDAVLHDLELGRNLDQIAVRVLDHEEEVIAGTVAPRSPPQGDPDSRHVVGPVAQLVPRRRLVAMMIGARLGATEYREAVMLGVRAEEADRRHPVGAFALEDVIGDDEA